MTTASEIFLSCNRTDQARANGGKGPRFGLTGL